MRELLHDAAPTPSRGLDMAEIRRRAAQRRLRNRITAALAALSALVVAALTAPGLAPSTVGSGIPEPTESSLPAPPDVVATPDGDDFVAAEPVESFVGPGSDGASTEPGSTGQGASGPRSPDAAPDDERSQHEADAADHGSSSFPPASRCQVDNVDLPEGETRTCRFTATSAGSAGMFVEDRAPGDAPVVETRSYPLAQVTVRRDGHTSVYTIHQSTAPGVHVKRSPCGVIEVGDEIEVRLTASDYDRLVWVGAGHRGAPEGDCAD